MHPFPLPYSLRFCRLLLTILALAFWATLLNPVASPLSASLISITVTAINIDDQPISGIQVLLWQRIAGQWQFTGDYSLTDSSGTHTFSISIPGTYTLEFSDPAALYLREFHLDKPSISQADPIYIGNGDTIAIATTLEIAGAISGVVTSAAAPNAPLSGASVELWRDAGGSWEAFSPVQTAADGAYLVRGLPTGNYRVRATSAGSGDYFPIYYPNTPLVDAAQGVHVDAGIVTPSINFALEPVARITGQLIPPAGHNAAGYRVCAVAEGETIEPSTLAPQHCALAEPSNELGVYTLTPLRAGHYTLYLSDGQRPPRVRNGWYADASLLAPNLAQSAPITLAMGTRYTATTIALEPTHSVYGTVLDAAGAPADGVEVRVYRPEGNVWRWFGTTATNVDGAFEYQLPLPGAYSAGIFDEAHAPRYHAGSTTFADATSSLTATVATLVVEHLQVGGTINGRVVDEANHPLAGIEVHAFVWQAHPGVDDNRRSPEWLRATTTGSDGGFTLRGTGDEAVWLLARDPSGARGATSGIQIRPPLLKPCRLRHPPASAHQSPISP